MLFAGKYGSAFPGQLDSKIYLSIHLDFKYYSPCFICLFTTLDTINSGLDEIYCIHVTKYAHMTSTTWYMFT